MIKIKYNNDEVIREASFSRTENIIALTGITDRNASGFKTYRMSGEQLGDFSDFTTIYDSGDDYVVFSNDGSVKPEQPETAPEESASPTPTIEERLDAIDSAIAELAELVGGTE